MSKEVRMNISLPKELEVDFRLFIVTHGGSINSVCYDEKLETFEDADEINRELLRQGDIAINDIEGSETNE